jgi:hypothetical protein
LTLAYEYIYIYIYDFATFGQGTDVLDQLVIANSIKYKQQIESIIHD